MDVRLEDGFLVLLGARVEGVAAEAEAGVVDEDVEALELLHGLGDEALAAGRVGDVELELEVRLEPVCAPRSSGDASTGASERAGNRRADPARGAGNDRRLALEPRHASELSATMPHVLGNPFRLPTVREAPG